MKQQVNIQKVMAAVRRMEDAQAVGCDRVERREKLGGTCDESASVWAGCRAPMAVGKRKIVRTTQGRRCRGGFATIQMGI